MENQDKISNLLDRAHDIRKFEIDLYWRRTTYFWTLIAATFVGFFAIQATEGIGCSDKHILSFVVSNLGFIFSLGWFLINKGSKFWQQNWETQVDTLEREGRQRLYGVVMYRPQRRFWMTDPDSYSPSKTNQITSFYVTAVWVGLGLWSFAGWHNSEYKESVLAFSTEQTLGVMIVLVLVTFSFCMLFPEYGKTGRSRIYRYEYLIKERIPRGPKPPRT